MSEYKFWLEDIVEREHLGDSVVYVRIKMEFTEMYCEELG